MGRVVAVLAGWSMPPAALYLVMPASGPGPTRVTAVLDFLAARLADGLAGV
jgi:DNA-binding transcriptional LysR family regulator